MWDKYYINNAGCHKNGFANFSEMQLWKRVTVLFTTCSVISDKDIC